MKNDLLVVIISCVWDVVIIFCFCGAIGGSTLLSLAFPCINGATKVTQHLRVEMVIPIFGCAVLFNPWYHLDAISGPSFCENQPSSG
jgi:hypothetical protein